MSSLDEKQLLLSELYEKGIIKYQPITLKNGEQSNFYIDARSICAYPEIFRKICDLLTEIVNKDLYGNINDYDCICGVPMGGITYATVLAQNLQKPLTYIRKEKKEHGLSREIEGYYKRDGNCIMVEDVITTGSSCLENEKKLTDNGFGFVNTIVTVFFRNNLINEKFWNKNLLSKKQIWTVFNDEDIKQFHKNWQTRLKTKLDYQKHSSMVKLIEYALEKNTNICASIDLVESKNIINLCEEIGDKVCMIKLHSDIIIDRSLDFYGRLLQLSREKKFVLCEDRKFSDIGNTMELQFKGGNFPIETYFDFVTSHAISGESSLKGLHSNKTSILVVTDMSTKNNLMTKEYREEALKIALNNRPYVSGIVSQQNLSNELLTFTPGISIKNNKDGKGQSYNTPDKAMEKGSDFLIIGRSIYESENPKKVIEEILEN